MSRRTRFFLVLAAAVLLTLVVGRIARDWSDAEYYGAVAGVITVTTLVGLPWMEMAKDGDLRRPRT